jgi:hypothetical protein
VFTYAFWKATAERVIGTFAATVLGLNGADGLGVLHTDWAQVLYASAIIAGLTLLKCLAASLSNGTPSATNAEVPASRHRAVG